MKYFFYKLEIQDGEHGYYYRGVLEAKTDKSANNKADEQAKKWYDDKPEITKDAQTGGFTYYFPYVQVIVCVDEIMEISKEHFDILKIYL